MPAKFTFALKGLDRKLLHISEITDRRDALLCLECHAELIAVINVRKVTAHFRHKSDDMDCSASYESALHQAAKAILLKHRSLFIPGYGDVNYEDPVAEQGCDRFRPDVTIQTEAGEVYIEIVVSNHPSEEKEFYYGQRKALCLIIDMSDIDHSIDLRALEGLVLTDSGYKRVIQSGQGVVKSSNADSSDNWAKLALVVVLGLILFNWIKSQIGGKKVRKRHR